MLREIIDPTVTHGQQSFWWWDSVDGTVRELTQLSLDAKLVACIDACSGMDASAAWNE